MTQSNLDGKPDEVKVSCPVLSGGKSRDNIKGLPIAISAERRAGELERGDLETVQKVGRDSHRHHAEQQRPSGKPGNLQYPGKLGLHLYAQSGGGRSENPCQAAQHQPPSALLRHPLRRGRGAAVLWQRDSTLCGPFPEGYRAVSHYDNEAAGNFWMNVGGNCIWIF